MEVGGPPAVLPNGRIGRLALSDAGRTGSQHDGNAVISEPVRGFLHRVGDLGDGCKYQTVVATVHRLQSGRDGRQRVGNFADMYGTARDEVVTRSQPASSGKERPRYRVLADTDRRGDAHSDNSEGGAAHRFISED